MRIATNLALPGLLFLCLLLPGCVSFCEEPGSSWADLDPRPCDPLPEGAAHYDARGRRCVDVTAFDVYEAFEETSPSR